MTSKEQIVAEYNRGLPQTGSSVTVMRVDLSFGDIFILAIKFGIVWAVLGFAGTLLFYAVT